MESEIKESSLGYCREDSRISLDYALTSNNDYNYEDKKL